MWKTLQDKTEIRINLEETWKKQRQKEVNNRKETGKRLMTFYRRQQDGSVDSVRQESQLYILQKTIRMQMEAWTLLYIVEDNKDRRRKHGLSQTKGADYMHLYMKQGLGGS
jgi:hypothetical protein